jgi:predicted permease
MGVFGNSNSLPISLVISLSQTLKGLHWSKVPGDDDDEVAARGILYLMIFQQLGQLVRWSWGYHVLLAPKDKYEEYRYDTAEEGRYLSESEADEDEREGLIRGIDSIDEIGDEHAAAQHNHQSDDSDNYEPAGRTPVVGTSRASPNDSEDEDHDTPRKRNGKLGGSGYVNVDSDYYNDVGDDTLDSILSFPRIRANEDAELPSGIRGVGARIRRFLGKVMLHISVALANLGRRLLAKLPRPLQKLISSLWHIGGRVSKFLWEFMNPPLWAMLIAVLVASIPSLQKLFFEEGSFIKNSVTSAVSSSAGVAVPLILVVLGANLARNTEARDDIDPEEKEIGTRLVVAALLSRMLLPTLIMAPILALFAKYVPISILGDPIFVIVCFLLTGAPSALQLAQICQINGVFENSMGKILFQSYVIW